MSVLPRDIVPTLNSASEKSTPTATNLGAGLVTSTSIVPKSSRGQRVIGMLLQLDVSITQTTATDWNASMVFAGLQIKKIEETRLNVTGYKQLLNLFNILTRQNASNAVVWSDGSGSGSGSATFKAFLPLQYTTNPANPVMLLSFNGLGSVGATQGTVTSTVTYYYAPADPTNMQDDLFRIVTAPATLNSNVDIDVSAWFPSGFIRDIFADITTDGNIEHQSFTFGNTPVFERYSAFELRALTNAALASQSVDGLLQLRTIPTAYPLNAVSTNKPSLWMRFNAALAPTFYLLSKINVAPQA